MENDVIIRVNPALTADDLFAFYERNNVCEAGFGKEKAAKILRHPHLIVAAHMGRELVGLARATFDGFSGQIRDGLCSCLLEINRSIAYALSLSYTPRNHIIHALIIKMFRGITFCGLLEEITT